MNTYNAKVLADSISPDGVRLTTIEATFPRFILAEVNTHRVFSRNSASSRAIPTEKQIERAIKYPFVPETFNKRVKGMGVGDAIHGDLHKAARDAWLYARDKAVQQAVLLNDIGIDKSRVNRLLEPFMWHTAIISSTEWDNFLALRVPPGDEPDINFPAQVEFQHIGILMREAMAASSPQALEYGQWHLPLVDADELAELCANPHLRTMFKMVSAGRVARVSYDTHENFETRQTSYQRAERLMTNGHLSPFEHVARPIQGDDNLGDARGTLPLGSMSIENVFVGNFRGWKQFRKEIPNEDNYSKVIA